MAAEPREDMPEVGQRVVLTCDVERFDHAYVRAGAAGTVRRVAPDAIDLLLDEDHPGLAEWDNCLVWHVEMETLDAAGRTVRTLAEAFWSQVAEEAPAPGLR